MNNFVIVSTPEVKEQFLTSTASAQILTAEEYLKGDYSSQKNIRLFNLCNDYSYCKRGYYVSLLAEARGHRPLPSVSTIGEFGDEQSLRVFPSHFNESVNKALSGLKSSEFEISVYFGKNLAEKYNSIARTIFNHFQSPLLRAYFVHRNQSWILKSLSPIAFKDVPENHREFVVSSMTDFFQSNSSGKKRSRPPLYEIAILANPEEKEPPSDEKAIKSFISAAEDLRMHAEVIGPKDLSSLNKYDALFIRETTSVTNHTMKFSRRAAAMGLVVIDDPKSILRCCNKVYLNDYLLKKKLATPGTRILFKGTDLQSLGLTFPLVIKKPDSAFSAGVKKVSSLDELVKLSNEFFEESDLLILQSFVPTEFDWRIGFIDNEPLYACKYFMAKDHWQIINHSSKKERHGMVETVALSEVPKGAMSLAKRACESIGDSLYGVDIKEKDGKFYVVEINDNPSIEKGIEDEVAGDALYLRVMSTFLRRLEVL
ncbi:MAG: RimK family protein [Bdellovibrionales bacterium]|nr:RimK family protein [Bdellovibrionales bacterium]